MSVKIPSPAIKGSQMWLQSVVNEKPDVFQRDLSLAKFAPQFAHVIWLSPLKSVRFAEYSDDDSLDHIGRGDLKSDLERFWPKRGPVWDGLATTDRNHILLIEAKAHIDELHSPPSRAGEESLKQIQKSLEAVKANLGVKLEYDWTGHFYQYTNRLAHLHFLRERKVPAYLVFVYFLNDTDMKGPATRAEWEAALHLMHMVLGTGHHNLSKYVVDVFVDTNELKT